MNSPSEKSYPESQTAISGLGRRVGQLDVRQTENAEYQGTEPDQSPHEKPLSTIKNYEITQNSNIIEYINALKRKEDVASIKHSVTNYTLGSSVFSEMYHFPQAIMNELKPRYKPYKLQNDVITFSRKSYIIYTRGLGYNYLNLNNQGIAYIDNLFDFVKNVLYDVANSINSVLLFPSSYSESILHKVVKQREFKKSTLNTSKKFIKNYTEMEIRIAMDSRRSSNQKNSDLTTPLLESASTTLLSYLVNSIKHSYPVISNLIIELSMNPDIYYRLVNEQRSIIKTFGNEITEKSLDNMMLLDAAFLESTRLSGTGQPLRQLETDVYLSNGSKLKKNSLAKFNNFIYNRDNRIYEKLPHSFKPDRYLRTSTKFSQSSKNNITWGIGRKTCPYTRYSSLYLKMFVAIFLRKYKILFEDSMTKFRHRGYNFGEAPIHSASSLHIKPFNILEYDPLNRYTMDLGSPQ
ncbi:hypothetical protein BB560_000187 [Smittium megazygosporum]|uniref:Cytochrome P450 n=1 Tax=Smittium megazygosporum TaxID=133381 RepID=A0A2T9ZL04_9FUNG|nr:hypothetical protein BB560_000187 [Smittium megazygosporum]